jgi:hypothetical protein
VQQRRVQGMTYNSSCAHHLKGAIKGSLRGSEFLVEAAKLEDLGELCGRENFPAALNYFARNFGGEGQLRTPGLHITDKPFVLPQSWVQDVA